jgi:hypothetical protein
LSFPVDLSRYYGHQVVGAMGMGPKEYGTVTGRTLSAVHGHPGALRGSPDPNYKPPPPAIAGKEKLYWLCVTDAGRQSLMSTESNPGGNYTITLPPGRCYVEPAATHAQDLSRIEDGPRRDDAIVRALFPQWRLNSENYLKVEKQKTYTMDVEARILFVD